MKNSQLIIPITVMAVSISSCQKKEEVPAQPDKVDIEITSPKADLVYHKGDTIKIAGTATYVSQMHGYTVAIYKKGSETPLYEGSEHTHGDKLAIEEHWVDTLSESSALTLKVNVIIDHDNNTSTKELDFSSQP